MPTRKILNIGSFANDGTGDTLRDAADKINHNFGELYNKHAVQQIVSAATIEEDAGVIIFNNGGFSVSLDDGTELGQTKFLINQSTGTVTVVGNFIGGGSYPVAALTTKYIIWSGSSWALVS